jgi:predicted GIY-YIG superfamily endonuclease
MAKNRVIEVKNVYISVSERNNDDFISLTSIATGFEGGSDLIEKWLRSYNTIAYLAAWECKNNINFNQDIYKKILAEVGTNRFMMSAKKWITTTSAIGLKASAGRYGGTYARLEIALEFATWLNPSFKLQLWEQFIYKYKHEGDDLFNNLFDVALFGKESNCYVYLMQDLTTKLYKIGVSKNVIHRERTLQSEKPSIFLYTQKLFLNKKEACQLEQKIHKMYETQRVRGEWFNLSSVDLQNIEQIINE